MTTLRTSCSKHGEDLQDDCVVCQEASKVPWVENVRVNRPDAPAWLWSWASAMDNLDAMERTIESINARLIGDET